MKVASILVPQAKPLYPCLLLEKALFDPGGSSVVMYSNPFTYAQSRMMCIMGIIIHLVKLKLMCKRIQMVQ